MKKIILLFLLLFTSSIFTKSYSQGFQTTVTNWTLPPGGHISGGDSYGFYSLFGSNDSENNSLGWTTMDMNGDGKMDLVVTSKGNGSFGPSFNVSTSPYWKVYLNTGSGFSTTVTNWTLPSGGYSSSGNNYGFFVTSNAPSSQASNLTWSTFDINGDKKPDLVVTGSGNGSYSPTFSVFSNPYWKVYLNTGTGFSTTYTNWPIPSGGYIYAGDNYGFYSIFSSGSTVINSLGWSTFDINGDDKPDLVATSEGNGTINPCFGIFTTPYWKVYLNTGSGFSTSATNWTVPSGGAIYSGTNYGFHSSFESGSSANNSLGWSTMDLNGDKKPDMIVTSQGNGTYDPSFSLSSNPYWKVYLNTGTAFSTSSINWKLPTGGMISGGNNHGFNSTAGGSSATFNSVGWSTFDINADGKADLVTTSEGNGTFSPCFGISSNPHWKVYLNNGIGFLTTSTNWTIPSGGQISNGDNYGFYSSSGANSSTLNSLGWSTSDINGDANPDLIVTSMGNGTYGPSFSIFSGPYWKVYINPGFVGTEKLSNDFRKTIAYPNPFSDVVTLISPESKSEESYFIFDVMGRKIKEGFFTELNSRISLAHLPAGIFFLHIGNDKPQVHKIIKQ